MQNIILNKNINTYFIILYYLHCVIVLIHYYYYYSIQEELIINDIGKIKSSIMHCCHIYVNNEHETTGHLRQSTVLVQCCRCQLFIYLFLPLLQKI